MDSELPIIDIHTHLVGVGHGGSGCWIAPRRFNCPAYRVMRRMLAMNEPFHAGRMDEAYLRRMADDLADAVEQGVLDGAVVFPHERVYTPDGKPSDRQEIYVPNEYAFACAERSMVSGGADGEKKWRFLPAMSVHPYRPDAVEQVSRWIAAGAVAMKWLPNSQGIDGRDKRCQPIYELLARYGLPLIVHTGGEHTVKVIDRRYGNPANMEPALQAGVTVVMAHCGTRSFFLDENYLPTFLGLARKYPNCYGDTSAFSSPGRARWARRMLRYPDVLPKLVHGSDFPIPPVAMLAVRSIGWAGTRRIGRIESWLARDVAIKRAHGLPDVIFTNAAKILRPESLQRWGIR